MHLIEIPGTPGTRRFINLDRVTLVTLKQDGEIWLEPVMESVEKNHPSYKELLKLIGIKEQPASEMDLMEEEREEEKV